MSNDSLDMVLVERKRNENGLSNVSLHKHHFVTTSLWPTSTFFLIVITCHSQLFVMSE